MSSPNKEAEIEAAIEQIKKDNPTATDEEIAELLEELTSEYREEVD